MSDMPNTLDEMISLLEAARADYDKFYNGSNSSAGTRVRKVMQEIKNTAHAVRLHVQATKNDRQFLKPQAGTGLQVPFNYKDFIMILRNLLAVMACFGIMVACNPPADTVSTAGATTTTTTTNVETNAATNNAALTGTATTTTNAATATGCDCSACPGAAQNVDNTNATTTTSTTGAATTTATGASNAAAATNAATQTETTNANGAAATTTTN